MKPTSIIQRLVILLITLMSAIGAKAAVAYASYNEENKTLTFYYDRYKALRLNTYSLNTDYDSPGWYTDGTYNNVTKVVFNSSFADARPTSTYSWFYNMANLQSIEGMNYLNTSEVTNMAWMFGYCSRLTSLDLSSFNTAKVTDMDYMFNGCTNLQTIYTGSKWRTNNVSSSTAMFSDCSSLKGGKDTSYNSSNPTDKTFAQIDGGSNNPGYFTAKGTLAYACYTESNTTLTFYYDNQRNTRSGTTYDLNTGENDTGWETSGTNENVTKVVFDPSFAGASPTTTYRWFFNMTNLASIEGISYLNTSEVTNMDMMFMYCYELIILDLSKFNTAKVTTMECMFDGCIKLKTIYVGSGWNTDAVTTSDGMFYYCIELMGGKYTTYDPSHVDKTYARIDGGSSAPGYLIDINLPIAYACYTPSNTTLTFYYDKLRGSRSGTIYRLNTGSYITDWQKDDINTNVTKVILDPSFAEARPITTCNWFFNMTNLASIEGISYLNTSEVTNMKDMFTFCKKLTSLDLSSFNTSKVTDMSGMFIVCTNLRTIYVGNGWRITDETDTEDMFYGCTSLVGGQGTTYDANHVDADYARIDGGSYYPGYFSAPPEAYVCYTPGNTTLTFYYDDKRSSRTNTYSLNTGSNNPDWDSDGNSVNVTKVVFDSKFAGALPTSTYSWFSNMVNLQSITGLSYLNTSEVTNMAWMFCYCYELTSLDLSSFNTSKVTTMEGMFYECLKLQTIYVGSGWTTNAVATSDDMFYNCIKLVGVQGTKYNDSNPNDKTYARIDDRPSNPGYFTERTTGIATDIDKVQRDSVKGQRDEWFTLDGQKLSGKPTKRGVYIHNGKAVANP